ncbi:MAG TPA: glycine zipper 2TM domain-containing protein [Allosphingosinicella sp.]
MVGGVAGALLGREVTRDRYRGRSGTTGAILGGAIGALAGRAVQKSSCR